MFALFPVYGVTQGFLPIAGYNYGAQQFSRVREAIKTAILYATVMATLVFAGLMLYPQEIASFFLGNSAGLTAEELQINSYIIGHCALPMRLVFAATPIIALQLIGAGYYQAIGKVWPAFLLTLCRQGFFFIPLLFVLPHFFGELGVWVSFPISDVIATVITGYFLRKEVRATLV